MLSMQSGFLHRAPSPIQLTNGPLSYRKAVSSRDGKQIFAVGVEARGELVRYDANSKQFLPLLPGVPAFDPSWSADGKWVAYTAYPDHALWRSRSDGTDALQLTSPPWTGVFPRYFSGRQTGRVRQFRGRDFPDRHRRSIAPDDGGEGRGLSPHWSPDASLLAFRDRGASPHIDLLDLHTGRSSLVPGSAGMWDPPWAGNDRLVAATGDSAKLRVFDVRTQQWSDLVTFTAPGYVVNWTHSPDYKSVDLRHRRLRPDAAEDSRGRS